MSIDDAASWDERYAAMEKPNIASPPSAFAHWHHLFPRTGTCVDVACGLGGGAVWLAQRGLHATGYDVSPVAIAAAQALAEEQGVAERCQFDVADLDDGIPGTEPANLVVCHMFRAPALYPQLAALVAPGGYLAIAVLSEVGHVEGRFRARPGELVSAFIDDPDVAFALVEHRARDGQAALLAHRPPDVSDAAS